jgi:hypothetical protein
VRWLSGPHRAILLGFPLFFGADSSARELALKALDDLGEPYGIAEAGTPDARRLTLTVFPNPARGAARISYALARAGDVRVSVCDVAGRVVRELLDSRQAPGRHVLGWDGTDARGRQVGAGVYLCRVEAGEETAVGRLVLTR